MVFEALGASCYDILKGNDFDPFPMHYIKRIGYDVNNRHK